jgi:adenine-specific DNA-methyltransferase
MILGDSLQVMASLAEREGLRGKVQCIYIDPPYGIKFNSNFQWSTTSRDVKDGKADHITREPEQVKAFRDTWRDGIHSYLTYLRDRLTVARDLISDSGSIFVQIGDENVHRVRTTTSSSRPSLAPPPAAPTSSAATSSLSSKRQSCLLSGSMTYATPALQYSSWQASTQSTSRNSWATRAYPSPSTPTPTSSRTWTAASPKPWTTRYEGATRVLLLPHCCHRGFRLYPKSENSAYISRMRP